MPTAPGTPVPAPHRADHATGVEHVLRTLDTAVAVVDGICTSCDERYWSYRDTGTTQRQAMVAWIQPGPG